MLTIGVILWVLGLTLIARGEEAKDQGSPHLVVRVSPPIALAGANGVGVVTLFARVEGRVEEDWYCARIEWYWPDKTKKVRESDCEPYEEGASEYQPYDSVTVGLPAGPEDGWSVRVELWKAGRLIATQVVRVVVK